jgi:5-methyltetrahydropteroyltriglutamate--homocysteine methyltransferase
MVEGPVRRSDSDGAAKDYEFAAVQSPVPVKAVVTGPYTLAALSANHYYGSLRELVLALAGELRNEVLALERAGAPIIQVNEPAILQQKEDFPLLRQALGVMMDGVRTEAHLYTWFGDIGGLYPQVLELPFAAIGLDFVKGPANWDVIAARPFTKNLGLGVVDARNTMLESDDDIVGAVRRASGIVSPDGIYVNPSCGLEYLPREVAQAKLIRMVEGVRRAQEVLS